ncbi:MAG: acyltransferase [Vulcanimicrobiaceae bacterium]
MDDMNVTVAGVREHARRRTDVLDGLRGLAIFLVLTYHTWLFSWYTPDVRVAGIALPFDVVARTGYLGVELFFFISAFVLFFPIAERRERGARTSLRTFAYRRLLKIAPSYAIALVATTWSIRSLHVDVALSPALAEHAFFVQNFFNTNFGQANSVFWSLAIEVQFYCIFPAVARAFVRRPISVAAIMIACALAYRYGVAACCLQDEPVNRQIPAFLDIFAAGMACAYAVAYVRARESLVARVRPLATVVAIAAACGAFVLLRSANDVTYDIGGRERWILAHRTIVALDLGVLVFASAFATERWKRIVVNPPLVALSVLSYNLYLWHTLVMIWLWKHHAIASATPNPQDDPQWKVAFIATGWTASLAIAAAVTYFVERPLLATVKPQSFAFDWRRLRARSQPLASPETRT